MPQTKLAAAKAQRRQASLRRWMRELKTVSRKAKFARADKRVNRAQKKLVARLRASVRANQKAQKAVRRLARMRKAVLKLRRGSAERRAIRRQIKAAKVCHGHQRRVYDHDHPDQWPLICSTWVAVQHTAAQYQIRSLYCAFLKTCETQCFSIYIYRDCSDCI